MMALRTIADGDGEMVASAIDKAREVRKRERAGVEIEVVVVETPRLTTKLERVVPSQIVERVRNNNRGIGTALREAGRTTNVEVETGDTDLR